MHGYTKTPTSLPPSLGPGLVSTSPDTISSCKITNMIIRLLATLMSSISNKPLWARRLVSRSVPRLVCKTVDGSCETCELFAQSCALFGLPKRRGVSAVDLAGSRPTRDADDEIGEEQDTGTLVILDRTRLQLKCPIRARHSSMEIMADLWLDTFGANIAGVATRD